MKYTVVEGDSLSKIARDVLGNMDLWPQIAEINGIEAPYTIYPGQTLTLPVAGEVTTLPATTTTIPATGPGLAYTVQKNLPLIALAIIGGFLIWWGMKK